MADTHDDSRVSGGQGSVHRTPQLVVLLECDRPLSGGARYALDGIDRVTIGRGGRARSRTGGGERPPYAECPHPRSVGLGRACAPRTSRLVVGYRGPREHQRNVRERRARGESGSRRRRRLRGRSRADAGEPGACHACRGSARHRPPGRSGSRPREPGSFLRGGPRAGRAAGRFRCPRRPDRRIGYRQGSARAIAPTSAAGAPRRSSRSIAARFRRRSSRASSSGT